MITPVFTVDIGVGIRRSTNDPADNQLIFADQQVRVNIEENGAIWPIPAGATFDLVIVSREDPPGGLLAKSTSSGPVPSPTPTPTADETGTVVFQISTNTVELRAHLAGARGKQCIVELVRTDLVVPQTLARWQVVCWNQGYDPVAAVYAELKHNTSCNPNVAPTVDDDSLLGYAIGSIWVYCAGDAVYLCLDATPGAAEWRRLTVAADEFYDNTTSGLVGVNVQDAIDEVAAMSGGPHGLSDPLVHTSALTNGRMMKADANGLPADGTNTDTDVADAVTKRHSNSLDHARSHGLASGSDHTSALTPGKMVQAAAVTGLPADGTNTDTEVASAVSLKHSNSLDHARQHNLATAADHVSSLTPGKIVAAAAVTGLPADGTNTDTEVASAVSLKHTQGTDQGLDTGGLNAVVVADVKSAVSLKHSQGTDQGLDTGGTNAVTAAQAKAAYTHSGLVTGNPHAVTAAQAAALPIAGGTMAGEINLADNLLTRPYAKDVAEVLNALGSVSGNPVNIDLEAGNVVSATNGGALTFVFLNPPASGRCGTFVLILTNGGAALVTWPAAVKWPGGTKPTLTTSGVDVLVFFTTDAGTTWRGAMVQADSK